MDESDRVLYCESEIQVLRDTVWRLTSRVHSLEHNISKLKQGDSTIWTNQSEQSIHGATSTVTSESIDTYDGHDGDLSVNCDGAGALNSDLSVNCDGAGVLNSDRAIIKTEPFDQDDDVYVVRGHDYTLSSISSSSRKGITMTSSTANSSFTPLSHSSASSYYAYCKQLSCPSGTQTQSSAREFNEHYNLLHNPANRSSDSCKTCTRPESESEDL